MTHYKGSCHCGFVRFSMTAQIDHARQCNCSICSKRATLNFRVASEAINIETPLEALTLYQWGSQTAKDYICPTCGILAFRRPAALTAAELAEGKQEFTGWAVNLRCIDGLDVDALPVVRINGAAL